MKWVIVEEHPKTGEPVPMSGYFTNRTNALRRLRRHVSMWRDRQELLEVEEYRKRVQAWKAARLLGWNR